MARKRRPLAPEDEAIWQQVARTARPLHPKARIEAPKQPKTPGPSPPQVQSETAIPEGFSIGGNGARTSGTATSRAPA